MAAQQCRESERLHGIICCYIGFAFFSPCKFQTGNPSRRCALQGSLWAGLAACCHAFLARSPDKFGLSRCFPKSGTAEDAIQLLHTLVESPDELKRHVLVLFTANYETGLTAIRAVTVNRTLTIIDQVNWSCYIDLNSMAVVETVEEGNNNYDTPDMGIKLTKKAELRKKKVAELKKFDERAEG